MTTHDNQNPKFIADCHLGKLAKYLRLMGVDTLFYPQIEDYALIKIAQDEGRLIITRDRELSERKHAPVYYLEPKDTQEQLKHLIKVFGLGDNPKHFSRCIVCNTPLEKIEKEKILDKIPEKVALHFNYFDYHRTG